MMVRSRKVEKNINIIKGVHSVAQHPDLPLVFLALAGFAPVAHFPLQNFLPLLADIRECEREVRQVGSFQQISFRDRHDELIQGILFHFFSFSTVDLILLQAFFLFLKQKLIVCEGLRLFLALLVINGDHGQRLNDLEASFENFFIFWGGLYKFQRIFGGEWSQVLLFLVKL